MVAIFKENINPIYNDVTAVVVVVVAYGGFLLVPHRCHNCGTVAPLLILYNKGATLCGTLYWYHKGYGPITDKYCFNFSRETEYVQYLC